MRPYNFLTIDGERFDLRSIRPNIPPPLIPWNSEHEEPYYSEEWMIREGTLWLVALRPMSKVHGMDDSDHWRRFFLTQPSPAKATWMSGALSVVGGGTTAATYFDPETVVDYGFEHTFLIRKGRVKKTLSRKIEYPYHPFGTGPIVTRLEQWVKLYMCKEISNAPVLTDQR